MLMSGKLFLAGLIAFIIVYAYMYWSMASVAQSEDAGDVASGTLGTIFAASLLYPIGVFTFITGLIWGVQSLTGNDKKEE